MKKITLLVTCIFVACGAYAKNLLPVDEAPKDQSFVEFRAKLIQAIDARDKNALLASVSTDIKNSFGGKDGEDEFIKQWNLDSPNKSSVWNELGWVLKHGGAFLDKSFCAPYVYSKWPEDLDPFEYYFAVTESNVPLMLSKEANSSVVKTLNYAVVKNLDQRFFKANESDLLLVESDGSKGFVKKSVLRSSIGYRACFKKINSKWFMWVLVQGD